MTSTDPASPPAPVQDQDEVIPGDRTGPPSEGGPKRLGSFILVLMLVTGLAVMYVGYLLTKLPPVKRPQLTYTIGHPIHSNVKDQAFVLGAHIADALSADAASSPVSSPTPLRDGTDIPKVEYRKKGE